MKLAEGVAVRLRKWPGNPSFFDNEGYMYGLAFKNKTFIIETNRSEDLWKLATVPEEPRLCNFVWRSEDLIPIPDYTDYNNPNYMFQIKKSKKIKSGGNHA